MNKTDNQSTVHTLDRNYQSLSEEKLTIGFSKI
jgi:hypothetical protein